MEQKLTEFLEKVEQKDDIKKISSYLKELNDTYQEEIDSASSEIKILQARKKENESKLDELLDISCQILQKLNIKKYEDEKIVISTTQRNILEVNEENILRQYLEIAKNFRSLVPEYIKFNISIDKTKLNNYIKSNPSILMEYPKDIHYKESVKAKIK